MTQSQSVPASIVIGGLLAMLITTLVGALALPDDGAKTVVAITNAVIGLISGAIGGYARQRSKGATHAVTGEFGRLLRDFMNKEPSPTP